MCSSDLQALAASRPGSVHRLELAVVIAEVLQRPDRQKFAAAPAAIERHCRVDQATGIECEHVLWRALRPGEVQMTGDEFADIGCQRVIDRNDVVRHGTNLRNRAARPGGATADVTPAKQSFLTRSRDLGSAG